jgi:outer membrane protein
MNRWARAACFVLFALAAGGVGATDLDALSDTAEAIDLDALSNTTTDVGAPPTIRDRPPGFLLGLVGGGVFNTGRFLGSSERVTVPLPLVYFNYNDRVYWSLGNVGGWLLHTDDRSFKFGIEAKAHGGIEGKRTGYEGILDRKASADAGFNMMWRVSPVTVGASVMTDIGGRSHGQTAKVHFSFPIRLNERWTLKPNLSVEWLSRKTVDYYYGVHADETGGGAPLYAGHSNMNVNATLIASARLFDSTVLLAGISHTRFGSGLTDSPLTSRKHNTLVFVGASWVFLHLER